MAVTIGPAIAEMASEFLGRNDGAAALICDAVGSETADAAMDWLHRFLAAQLRRRGSVLTPRRFSAGYGDFSLEHQRLFYGLLDLERLGVHLTQSCMLVPEKTVTAVAGVGKSRRERI
jgi:cobalamin-dependent methionine synthase I